LEICLRKWKCIHDIPKVFSEAASRSHVLGGVPAGAREIESNGKLRTMLSFLLGCESSSESNFSARLSALKGFFVVLGQSSWSAPLHQEKRLMQVLPKADARQASGKNSPTHANALGLVTYDCMAHACMLTARQAKKVCRPVDCRRSIIIPELPTRQCDTVLSKLYLPHGRVGHITRRLEYRGGDRSPPLRPGELQSTYGFR